MTQPHLLEQAKQGDPQAIAALMNKSLQPKGMTAYVERQGDHLEVVLKSDRIPNRQALTAFVEQGIHNLGVESIRSVTVSGQQLGASSSAWTEELALNPLIPDFEPEFADPVAANTTFDSDTERDVMASFSSSEPSDLAQLQNLLSDESDHSSADPQRQELENRLESLWLEQSQDQHQDFLAELMADEPQDATRQFEEFLAEQPDDRFQSLEQEGLWNGSESDNLLADLDLEDSKQALTQELENSSYGWQDNNAALDDAALEEDEPDEVLFNFMEDQPQPAEPGLDADGELLDEPDEILPGFLERDLDRSPADSNHYDASFQTQSSDYSALDEQPIDFLSEISLSELQEEEDAQSLGLSPDAAESSNEEFLDLLGDSDEEQDQGLLSELTDPQPGAMDWDNNNSEPTGEFSFGTSPDSIDELSLGVEEEPASSEIDFAGEYPEASADAASQDWEHPPIEFLQSEPEPPSLELPTEQFDAPADFRTESSLEDSDRLADFPPDFLQEAPADQSHDLFVEPQTNPFIEQMEEQDRERSQQPEDRPGEEPNQFNQSEWLLEDTAPDSQSSGIENPQYSEDSDPLSDEALINFFEEDTEGSGAGAQFPSGTSQFDTDQFSEYRVRPDNPDGYLSSPEDAPADRGEFVLDESMSLSDLDRLDQEEDLDLSLEPDEPEPSSYYGSAGIADTQIPSHDIPDSTYSSDPAYAESSIADTQIPAYQEPSSEELEQQVAAIYPDDRPVYPDDRPVVANSGAELEPVSESRGSPWLFPLILLGISGWIVGLISFAFLWSRLSSPPPETAETSPADVAASPNVAPTACPPTTEATGNVPIALSELQFQQNESNPQQINLTGCVTNRTQQAIDIVSIGYRSGSGRASTVGGLNFSTGIIQPGQTVPFTSKFTLPSDTTDLSINTLYWQPAGQTTSREANTSVNLNR